MGFPRTTLDIFPIAFVLTSDGRVETLGGFDFSADELVNHRNLRLEVAARGLRTVAGVLELELRRRVSGRFHELQGLSFTTRLRPLMPRLRAGGGLALPIWTVARVDRMHGEPAEWEHMASRHPHGFGALARVAGMLQDASVETEAESEFRRTIAADPLACRMVGDDARLRALAADELAQGASPSDLPAVFAILPECFTIDELRLALGRMSRTPVEEIESSSNFRRRLHDLIGMKVLRSVGEAGRSWLRVQGASDEDAARPGRKPLLYTFDPERWRSWLLERAGGDEGMRRRESAMLMQRISTEERLEEGLPMSVLERVQPMQPIRRVASVDPSVSDAGEARKRRAARFDPTLANRIDAVPPIDARVVRDAPSGDRDAPRVARDAPRGDLRQPPSDALRAQLGDAEARLARMYAELERERQSLADVLRQVREAHAGGGADAARSDAGPERR